MRIGAFEVDLVFRETLCLSEVISGKASLLRACAVQNVRGTESDGLQFQARIGAASTARRAVRSLRPGAQELADAACNRLLRELCVPASLRPGHYDGRLSVSASSGEKAEVPFRVQILSASYIPTDFAHAAYLAAHVRTEDAELKAFAAEALRNLPTGADAVSVMRGLYDSLLERRLIYQPVSTILYRDYETVMDPSYVLRSGGSCADLSLLFASLLWQWGCPPALILFQDHMCVGVFPGKDPPAFTVLTDASAVRSLFQEHLLLPLEVTGACTYRSFPFDQALLEGMTKVSENACCIVHVQECLRSGLAVPLTQGSLDRTLVCPVCGYDHLVVPPDALQIVCPACGETVPVPSSACAPASPASIPLTSPASVRYKRTGTRASAERLLPGTAGSVSILPSFEGTPVTRIAPHAFENSRITQVFLPESIEEIGDRAFYGCDALAAAALPDSLSVLGTAAFASTAVERIRIPGSVRRISRLAFSACTHLRHLEIAEGVEIIDDRAFQGCSALTSVLLPASVKTVARSAFDPLCSIQFLSPDTRMK